MILSQVYVTKVHCTSCCQMIFAQAYSLTDALLCISTYQFAFSHMSFVFANMSYVKSQYH